MEKCDKVSIFFFFFFLSQIIKVLISSLLSFQLSKQTFSLIFLTIMVSTLLSFFDLAVYHGTLQNNCIID